VEEHFIKGGFHGSDIRISSFHVQKMTETRSKALRRAFFKEKQIEG
jgi:hypothetical protein